MNDDHVKKEFDSVPSIPYFAYEGSMSRCERIIKKLTLALVITILLVFASNAIWLYAWMQCDYTDTESTETVDVDGSGDGIANYIGNDGDINNGEN